MKKFLFVFLFFLTLFCKTEAQQQNWQFKGYSPHFRHNNGVQILHSGRIVAAGGNLYNDALTSFFYSDDSCATWAIAFDSINAMMNDLHFPADSAGYSVGNSGLFYKTTDSGATWTRIPLASPLNARNFYGVHFTDVSTGIAVGGVNTTQTIMRTVDGGLNWTSIIDAPGHILNDVTFINPLIGFAVGDSGTALKTQNGGISWTPLTIPVSMNTRNFQSVCFINSSIGFIAGGNPLDANRTLLKTTDGGVNWTVNIDVVGSMANTIHFLTDSMGYIGGEDGMLLYTSNQGMTWAPFTISGNDTYAINDINFLNRGFGIASGIYGKTLIYYDSLSQSPTVTLTNPVIIVNPNAVHINGIVNAHGLSSTVQFEYGLTSSFGNTIPMTPSIVSANNQPVSVQVNGLITSTVYYGRIKISYSFGDAYSNTVLFYSDSTAGADSLVQAPTVSINNLATIINANTVSINGVVNAYQLPTTVEFEYGQTPAFGTTIAMTPSTTTSNNQYVSTFVTGLSLSTIYYGRIKVSNQLGVAYSSTIPFYTDSLSGLNFNFEYWNDFSTESISDWGCAAPVQKVLSYDGSFAVRLISENVNSPGAIFHAYDSGHGPPFAGLPFSGGRPDTLVFHVKYDVELSDTALIQLFFNSNGVRICDTTVKITGSSAGAFQIFKIPIHYTSLNTPDSMGILCICTNYFSGNISLVSEMTLDNIFFTNSTSQIVNSDMQSWYISTRNHAVSWYSDDDTNHHANDSTTVKRSTDAYSGNYALLFRTFAHINQHGSSLKTGPNPYWQNPDFPVFVRHTSLSGMYKMNSTTNDTFRVMVTMYNQGLQIGYGNGVYSNPVSNYTQFNVPINYFSSAIPDSASIQFFLGKFDTLQFAGDSWVLIDDLEFDAIMTAVNSQNENNKLTVFPNPAQNNINIILPDSFAKQAEELILTVFDMNGKKCLEKSEGYKKEIQLDVSELNEQVYFIEIKTEDRTLYSKLIIQR